MKRLVVCEHARIERRSEREPGRFDAERLEGRLYDRLHAFDHKEREEWDRVFEWGDGYARTTQWVGVVQVPGLQVEILPKIDVSIDERSRSESEEEHGEARQNLLYMLALSGNIPVRSRDVARLATRRAPLSETLSAIFAERLRSELLLGPERGYLEHELNLRCFKGKLLVAPQVLHNSAHKERFYCRFDEFSDDTLMNRIFKASCQLLLEATRSPSTQDALRRCLLLLDNVSEVEVQEADFSRIAINRQNERFADLLRFSQLLFSGRSPTVQAGAARTFSLLFDMNKVFERFLAAFMNRYVARDLDVRIFPQAAQHKRYLMESGGSGVLRLEPDLLVETTDGRNLVVDTKWKRLVPGSRGLGGVSEGDLYQLHAYTKRYGCRRSVLLYPQVGGLEPRDFDVLDKEGQKEERIAVRFVDLHRNLNLEEERRKLAEALKEMVLEGLELPGRAGVGDTDQGSAA